VFGTGAWLWDFGHNNNSNSNNKEYLKRTREGFDEKLVATMELEKALGKAGRLEPRKYKTLNVFVKEITKPWSLGCLRGKENSKANEKTGREDNLENLWKSARKRWNNVAEVEVKESWGLKEGGGRQLSKVAVAL
jgi:hypothetical protein